MVVPSLRLAVRALILQKDRLLLVNAYPPGQSDLWGAPGGGVRPGTSLRENLVREMHEETGLLVEVGPPALVNEFHDPRSGCHQIDVFFRCRAIGPMPDFWTDPAGIVAERRFFSREELAEIRFKPDSLPRAAWGESPLYDPLEPIIR